MGFQFGERERSLLRIVAYFDPGLVGEILVHLGEAPGVPSENTIAVTADCLIKAKTQVVVLFGHGFTLCYGLLQETTPSTLYYASGQEKGKRQNWKFEKTLMLVPTQANPA